MEQAVEAVVASYPDAVAYETASVAVEAVEAVPYQETFIISWIMLLSLVVISILVLKVVLVVKFWKACNSLERMEKILASKMNE